MPQASALKLDNSVTGTYVISDCKNVRHVVTHAGVVKGHKRRVEYDAERYEEIDKRVHDEQLDDASEALPAGAALPVKQELLYTEFQHLFGAHLTSEPSADETFNIINLTVNLRRRSSNYSTPAYMRHIPAGTQMFSKRLRLRLQCIIGSECPFIERLVLVKTFS